MAEKNQKPARTVFREELQKIMPGFKWTIKKHGYTDDDRYMEAFARLSQGFNRMCTIKATRTTGNAGTYYEVTIWGHGTHGERLASMNGLSLAQAFRRVQDVCLNYSGTYAAAASYLKSGRGPS